LIRHRFAEAPDFLQEKHSRAPRHSRTTRLLAAASLAALIAACTTSPTGRSQLMLISPESAIVQSKQAYLTTMGELDKDNKLVDDPLMADRVATITGRLVTEAVALYPHTKDWEWSVAIIDDDDTVNAWCMAGGRMAAYTGLFDQLGLTDDEFAQIMGHEISHALANHTAERMSRAIAINSAWSPPGSPRNNTVRPWPAPP
jgi:Zn-dependent protease with chaperone function